MRRGRAAYAGVGLVMFDLSAWLHCGGVTCSKRSCKHRSTADLLTLMWAAMPARTRAGPMFLLNSTSLKSHPFFTTQPSQAQPSLLVFNTLTD